MKLFLCILILCTKSNRKKRAFCNDDGHGGKVTAVEVYDATQRWKREVLLNQAKCSAWGAMPD